MSVRDRWSEVQEALGLCPQHSVLYPDLTAREHLRLYGRLKKGSGEVGGGKGFRRDIRRKIVLDHRRHCNNIFLILYVLQ